MPTHDDFDGLANRCDAVWTNTNGVYGCLVKGAENMRQKVSFCLRAVLAGMVCITFSSQGSLVRAFITGRAFTGPRQDIQNIMPTIPVAWPRAMTTAMIPDGLIRVVSTRVVKPSETME